MVILVLAFLGVSKLFCVVAVPIYIPINSVQRLPFLHTLSNTYYYISSFLFFDNNHYKSCEVLPNCGFDLHLPDY